MTEAARTWLYAPGDRPDRCLKALSTEADQVIWDLEDAVKADAKLAARSTLADLLVGDLLRVPWIRINDLGTIWGIDDLKRLAEKFGDRPARFVVPKATRAVTQEIAHLGLSAQWLFIVETAQGMADLLDMSRPWPTSGAARLAFGALDYRNDVGSRETPGEDELSWPRSVLVLASKVWGWAPPIDAVFPHMEDDAGLQTSTARARALGMAGKMIIHPRQIRSVHRAYIPTEEEVSWARDVVAGAEHQGAFQIRGMMVDRPVVERARQILAEQEGSI